MKFSKLSQLLLVSSIGLLVATCLSGCVIVTIDYVYVASATGSSAGSPGQIQIYAADAQSGALRAVDKAVPSGGTQPVAMVTTSDYANLYVANQGNNSIVHFAIAYDGSLTQKDTITTSAPPVAIAVNTANTYLYVLTGTTSATLTEYSLSGGAIGSEVAQESLEVPSYTSDAIVPTGVTVLPNNDAVFVTAYDQSAYNPGGSVSSSANPGWVFGYAVGSSGALTEVNGSPYQAGVKPTALAADPTNRFLYVTDFASNDLIGYTVQDGDQLAFMINGPFKTGNEPTAITIDPRALYIYVSNGLQNTVSAYAIALPSGTPSAAVGSTGLTTNATDTDPVAIVVDPALGRYVYTANNLGNSVSGFRLNANTGVLTATQATPYPTGASPTAIVAVPHGNHATESVTP